MAERIVLLFIITADHQLDEVTKSLYLYVMSCMVGDGMSPGVSSAVVIWVLFTQACLVQTSTCKQWVKRAESQPFSNSRLPTTECHLPAVHTDLLTASWGSLNINF